MCINHRRKHLIDSPYISARLVDYTNY
ncbi:hypothetical protein SPRA44_320070 [Serratia proteamaculans]|nr:hypothetical protein SPRA44_320070 [Serratia proteamaculans]